MHTRERGAVNTMFFLIIFVLMLGAGFFGYTQYDAARKMEAQVAASQAEMAKMRLERVVRDHLLEDTRKVIGEAGTYKGRQGWDYTADLEEARKAGLAAAEIPEIPNVTLPSQVTVKVEEFARGMRIPQSLTNGLADLLNNIEQAYKARSTELADAKSQMESLRAERAALEKANATINAERAAQAQQAAQEVASLRQFIESQVSEKQGLIDRLIAENGEKRNALSTLTEEHKVQQREWTKERGLLDAAIQSARSTLKMVNPPESPDGNVLSTSSKTNLGYVDLGTKDMLPVGAVFKVTDPHDGKQKAMAVVRNVERDRAEVMFYDVKDKFDFPVQGDKLSSPIYSPGVRRQVALLGRFGYPYTRDTIKSILENLGNKVHDKVGPGVDLVIIGDQTLNADETEFQKVEDSEEYKLANTLGVEFAPVHKVRNFFKL